MKIAHVRERTAPSERRGASPRRSIRTAAWLDLEVARRRAVAAEPARAHNSVLFRQPRHDARRPPRRAACASRRSAISSTGSRTRDDDDDAVLACGDLRFGPPVLRPPSFRDFYAFEQHVGTMWKRRGRRSRRPGTACRSSTSRTSRSSAARAIRSGRRAARGARLRARGGGAHRHAGRATCPRSAARRRSAATGPQRLVGPRPPARGDDGPPRAGEGQGLRARRSGRGWSRRTSWPTAGDGHKGYDLAMTATRERRRDRRAARWRRPLRCGRWSTRAAPTSTCGRASSSASGRWAPAACWRSATRRLSAGSSPATR